MTDTELLTTLTALTLSLENATAAGDALGAPILQVQMLLLLLTRLPARPPPPALCSPPSALCPLLYFHCPPPPIICHLSSIICTLVFGLRPLPCALLASHYHFPGPCATQVEQMPTIGTSVVSPLDLGKTGSPVGTAVGVTIGLLGVVAIVVINPGYKPMGAGSVVGLMVSRWQG